MTDQYRCEAENSNWLDKWLIDIGVVLKLKLTQNWHEDKWPIDIGEVPTQKLKLKLKCPIDIGTVPKNLKLKWHDNDWSI